MPDKPLDANVEAAMRVLYARPSPMGPPPVALKTPVALNIIGKGPVIQALPGPSVYLDKVPPAQRDTMPEKSAYSNNVKPLAKGEIRITAVDRTANDTKLSQDEMALEASFTDHEGHEWKIVQLALAPLSPTPDKEPWYGGVATDLLYHGETGKGTPLEPLVQGALLSWGWADIWKDGRKVAASALLHTMLTSDTRDHANGFKYSGYDSTKNPIRQIHLVVPPRTGLPSEGGFLHVMWENADIQRGTPQQIKARPVVREPNLPTLELKAVPYLKWDQATLSVRAGQRVRLKLINNDPISVHAFMMDTPEGHIHVPLPQGSTWVTSMIFDQPGEYKFWCPISNHQKRGMYGRVVVEGGVPGGVFPPGAGTSDARR